MSRLIDWYVVELRLLLNGKLPPDRADEIVKEAESHLRESVQNRMTPAVDEGAASKAAIEAYGRPERIAAAFFQKSPRSMLGLNPVWWASICGLIAIWCWNFELMSFRGYFDILGDTWQNGVVGIAGLAALGFLVAAVRAGLRSYRLTLTGLTVGAAALSIPLMSFWMVTAPGNWQGISRLHLSRDIANVARTVAKMDASYSFIERGINAYTAAKSSADLPPDLRDPELAASEVGALPPPPDPRSENVAPGEKFVIPGQYGVMALVDGRFYAFHTAERFEEAKKAWLEAGPKSMTALAGQRADFGALLQNARAAQKRKLFFFEPRLCKQVLVQTVALLPLLLLVDWIATLTVLPRRRWPSKRPELARATR